MQGNSRSVSTNQLGVHEKLEETVSGYLESSTQKPVQQHTQTAFEFVRRWLEQKTAQARDVAIILDSCCGVGESTWRLAKQYPNAVIIGVDKSIVRLQKHGQQLEYKQYSSNNQKTISSCENKMNHDQQELFQVIDNYCVVRADVIDFWRLLQSQDWQIEKHFIYYPNPYPKASQLQKRWHGSQSFKDIIAIGGELTVRSNWQIYIEEFARALQIAGKVSQIQPVEQSEAFTPFERKYWNSGQQSWQVVCAL